ncbi:hypothetical protein HK100_007838, partial [Physocladia obscura]
MNSRQRKVNLFRGVASFTPQSQSQSQFRDGGERQTDSIVERSAILDQRYASYRNQPQTPPSAKASYIGHREYSQTPTPLATTGNVQPQPQALLANGQKLRSVSEIAAITRLVSRGGVSAKIIYIAPTK